MFVSSLRALKQKLVIMELTLPEYVRRPYQKLLNLSKTAVSTILSLRIPVYRLEVDGSDGLRRLGYLGEGSDLNFLACLAGGQIPERQPVARTVLFRLRSIVQQMAREYDVVVVELPYRLLDGLFHGEGLLVTPWVRWKIDTCRSWGDIERAFHWDSVWSDLKKLKGSGIQCVHTHEQSAFESFYRDIYRPSMVSRHGDLATPTPLELLQRYFDIGWLTLYMAGEHVLGGAVQYVSGKRMRVCAMGFNGDTDRQQQILVTAATYYNNLHLAWEMHCRLLDIGLTRPLLNDGVARYKRKWGSTVMFDSSQNWGFWIHISHKSAEVVHFLAQHPWIWADHGYSLKGLLVIDNQGEPLSQADVDKACRRVWIPGLGSIVVYAVPGFAPGLCLSRGPIPALGPAVEWHPITLGAQGN